MARPNPRTDAALARHARDLVRAMVDPGERTMADEVEQSIRLLMPAGRANVGAVADALGTNVRTLQRRLDVEGTSFSELLDRRARAAGQSAFRQPPTAPHRCRPPVGLFDARLFQLLVSRPIRRNADEGAPPSMAAGGQGASSGRQDLGTIIGSTQGVSNASVRIALFEAWCRLFPPIADIGLNWTASFEFTVLQPATCGPSYRIECLRDPQLRHRTCARHGQTRDAANDPSSVRTS